MSSSTPSSQPPSNLRLRVTVPSPTSSPLPSHPPYPGDALIPDACMIYDHSTLILSPATTIFPWILQLGKSRGGWYLPLTIERFLPSTWKPCRHINPAWQTLAVGDRVDDYGFSQDDYFDVMEVDAPRALVYRSDRYGASFTWAILLHEEEGEGRRTRVHLRFRGRIRSTGWKRWVIVKAGEWLDWLTTAPMLAGLKERAEGRNLDG